MAEKKSPEHQRDGHGVIALRFEIDPNRKRGEPYKTVKEEFLIQAPGGKPGETIWVDELPADRKEAFSNFLFGCFSRALASRLDRYLVEFNLKVSDFNEENWAEFVRASEDLMFSRWADGQLDNAKVERLHDVLKEVLTQKLARPQQKPAKKSTRPKKR